MAIEAATGERINSVLDNTVCVSVALHRLGVTRKVRATAVEVDADKNMLRVSKKILDSTELKAISKIDGRIRRMLQQYALPNSSLFRGGIYCIPSQLAPTVDAELEQLKTEREALCEAFFTAYEQQAAEAREQLRVLYNTMDYPPISRVRRAFGMETKYVNMGVPENLEGISQAIFEREREKHQTSLINAADEIRMALRVSLKEMVDHMANKLSDSDEAAESESETASDVETDFDGEAKPRKKKFHASSVAKIQQFLSTFDAKNIGNDEEMARIVAEARQILSGVDPQKLRKDDDIRAYVQQGFARIQEQLNPLVVDADSRMYVDDDEDEAAA